jgi:hypothetical protein
MSESIINQNSDGTITISGVTLQPSGSPLTGATVTGTLSTASGSVPSGWSAVSFADQGGGSYAFSYTASIVPAAGPYNLQVTIVKSGLTLTINHPVWVVPNQI